MKYWIKLYHEVLDDPKMGRLSDHAWRRAIELFLLAGENDKGGLLPSIPDMTWKLRADEGGLLADLAEIEGVGIVRHEDDGWFVCKFAERQDATTGAERQRRYKEAQRHAQYDGNEHSDESVTNPVTKAHVDIDTDTDTDTDTELDADAPLARAPTKPEKSPVRQYLPAKIYPLTVSKPFVNRIPDDLYDRLRSNLGELPTSPKKCEEIHLAYDRWPDPVVWQHAFDEMIAWLSNKSPPSNKPNWGAFMYKLNEVATRDYTWEVTGDNSKGNTP